jgi:hypothetical protein
MKLNGWLTLGVIVPATILGCGGTGAPTSSGHALEATPASRGPVASASSAPTRLSSPQAAATVSPACPNPEGGSFNKCVGALSPGPHTTRAFQPQLTYVVPAGWGNYEDFEGQVLLLPPGATVEGVNPGTSDTLGIAASVAAPKPDCTTQRDFAVATTTDAYVAWLRSDPRFVASRPKAITVGRLKGVLIDVALAPHAEPTCSDPELGFDRFAEVMIGLPPSHFSASVTPVGFQRLYLFDVDDRLLAILVGDNPKGGSDYQDFLSVAQQVIESFRFDPEPAP